MKYGYDTTYSFGKKGKWVKWFLFIMLIFLVFVALYVLYNYSFIEEGYPYNKLYKSTIKCLLEKNIPLSVRSYTNILDSTQNLDTISLQELCQNFSCECQYTPDIDPTYYVRVIKTVSAEAILNCIKIEDWLRLALINWKIINMLNFLGDKRSILRTPNIGVYGVEHINILVDNKVKSLNELVRPDSLKIITDPEIDNNIKIYNLNKKDSELYRRYVKEFYNPFLYCMPTDNILNSDIKDIPVPLFAKLSTIAISSIFNVNSGCDI